MGAVVGGSERLPVTVYVLLVSIPGQDPEIEGVYSTAEKAEKRQADLLLKVSKWGGTSDVFPREVQ